LKELNSNRLSKHFSTQSSIQKLQPLVVEIHQKVIAVKLLVGLGPSPHPLLIYCLDWLHVFLTVQNLISFWVEIGLNDLKCPCNPSKGARISVG
jgi:hypothetical protein